MPRPCPIALTGLTPTEQVLLEGALFQSAGNQLPGAVLEKNLERALLIIANADDADGVRALRARLPGARVLLVGTSDQGTGWPVVPRPLRLHAVLEAARRSLAPVLEQRDHPPETDGGPSTRPNGWFRRFKGEGLGFMATQPFTARDSQGHEDFEQTQQHEPRAPLPVRSFEATQPIAAMRAAGAAPAPAGRFETISARGASRPDFEATQQIEREMPSVLPSNWENEVAEWEAELTARTTRVAKEPALPHAEQARSFAPTDAQPLESASPEFRMKGASPPSSNGTSGTNHLETVTTQGSSWRVLVVGAPGPATGGLVKTLRSAGFVADFADSAELALRSALTQAYQVVFLIEVSLGDSAIAMCRHIRTQPGLLHPGGRIAIVASHRSLMSRIRASFAGCDAWMTIPLDRTALVKYIQQTVTRTQR